MNPPKKGSESINNDEEDDISTYDAEVVVENNDNDFDQEEEEWLPDSEKAKRRAEASKAAAAAVAAAKMKNQYGSPDAKSDSQFNKNQRSAYTEEEEELIAAMGGKSKAVDKEGKKISKREPGYLGDSTLREIAMDYSVPICYLADVLATWGVPVPIDVNAYLGDMVTGEQVFAIVEAIHSLDLGSLNDRYCDEDLITLCDEYDIELKDAFELAVKERWNLPFGVRTFLRVEQEEELLRALADDDF
eukprot:15365506-Ditylum_brightwellii.AAC.2